MDGGSVGSSLPSVAVRAGQTLQEAGLLLMHGVDLVLIGTGRSGPPYTCTHGVVGSSPLPSLCPAAPASLPACRRAAAYGMDKPRPLRPARFPSCVCGSL
jgi:hypothetical protein